MSTQDIQLWKNDVAKTHRDFELNYSVLYVSSSLQYMEKEEAMNVLQFWLAADNFQNQLAAKKGQYDGQEAQNDAMILYDK